MQFVTIELPSISPSERAAAARLDAYDACIQQAVAAHCSPYSCFHAIDLNSPHGPGQSEPANGFGLRSFVGSEGGLCGKAGGPITPRRCFVPFEYCLSGGPSCTECTLPSASLSACWEGMGLSLLRAGCLYGALRGAAEDSLRAQPLPGRPGADGQRRLGPGGEGGHGGAAQQRLLGPHHRTPGPVSFLLLQPQLG